jgi:hypothetical protein
MAKIEINIASGGLGRQSANVDTWGGLFCEVDALPGGWAANEVKRIFKPEDLEEYGITEDAVNDNYKLVYWHVSEAFRIAPNSTLYLQLGVTAAGGTTAAIIYPAFHNFESRLRTFAQVLSTVTLSDAEVALIDDALTALFDNDVQPARCVATFKKDIADLIPDFSAKDYYRVMVDIANDLTVGGLAKTVFDSALGMCGAAGTFLGQLLLLSVHQKPSWRFFPINGGGRWELLGDINGDSVEEKTQTEIDAYATQGVNLMVRTPRLTNAYISNARTAGDTAGDYGIINNGRTIDKAAGLAYDGIVKNLDGPVYVDPNTGKLSPETVSQFEQDAYDAINSGMVLGKTGNDVELSVDLTTGSLSIDSVYIDPDQDVISTGQIVVEIRLVPVGAANVIVLNIGLVASLNS